MKYILMLVMIVLVGCASSGGIGIGFDRKGVVRVVYRNSPAEKADIQLDDVLLKPFPKPGRIGTMCLVKYRRGKAVFEKNIKRVDVDTFNRW